MYFSIEHTATLMRDDGLESNGAVFQRLAIKRRSSQHRKSFPVFDTAQTA
jgi:hypothetical protein